MDDVLACPHCGGRTEIRMGVGSVYVACRHCGARGGSYRFRWFDNDSYQQAENRAVRNWNRRLGYGRKR